MSKILILGAGIYQVPAIKRAKDLGLKVFCVDYKENQPGYVYADGYNIIDVKDKELCLSYAKEIGVDRVLTWGATLPLPTVNFIGEKLHIPCISALSSRISLNKFEIRRHLDNNGLHSRGNTFQINSWDELKKQDLKLPFVVKPSDGSGSKGVSIVKNEYNIEEAINHAFECARNNEIYFEPYIDGEEFSVEAYAHNGECYIYTIIKTEFYWKKEYPTYKQTTYLGISSILEDEIETEIKKAVSALELNWGPINFDIIVSSTDNKPYIIDVGIRNGQNLIASHIVPYSRGVDELDNSLNLCLGNRIHPSPVRKTYVSSRLLIYRPGIIKEIKELSLLIGTNHIIDIILRKKEGDILPPYQTKTDICGWVLTEGDTPEQASKNADIAWDMIKDFIIIE